MIGQTIAHFHVLDKLGGGGMGVVYLAEDTRLDRRVALKFLPPHLSGDEDARQRFVQEAKAASALNHANICTVYDIGQTDDGQTFIAMAHYEGETLKEKLERGALPTHEAVNIASQVAEGLAAAHDKRIVHRDIKPANIFVTERGRAVILDFGVAKLVGGSSFTQSGSTIGTLEHMAPEQIQGQDADGRTDIFALGTVLYQMLSGKRPFTGAHQAAVIYEILNVNPPPLVTLTDRASPVLDRIVMRCLEKDPERRYHTASDLSKDLERLIHGESVPIRHEDIDIHRTNTASKARPAASRRILATIGALAAVAVVITAIIMSTGGQKNNKIASLAVLPFENASEEVEMEYLSDGISESLISALSRFPELRVMSRNAVFRFKGDIQDPQSIAAELGVEAVVMGRVWQREETLHISAELIDARDNSQTWGGQYSRNAGDLLTLEAEITDEIARQLQIKFGATEDRREKVRTTENSEAYELYLKGRYFWARRTAEDLRKATAFFNDAVAIDPGYALSYAGLADAHLILGVYHDVAPLDAYPRALAAANRALEIDPSMAEPHATLGDLNIHFGWDWEAAQYHLERAVELDPEYATAHQWYAEYLTIMGRHEDARSHSQKARRLDPLSPIISTFVGWNRYHSRDYEAAIREYHAALDIDPDFAWAHYYLGLAYLQSQQIDEAIRSVETAYGHYEQQLITATLAHLYARTDRTAEARAVADKLRDWEQEHYVTPYSHALISLGFGDIDRTFELLENAYDERSGWLYLLKTEPLWDRLREDPRFDALLERMRLPAGRK